MTSFSVAAPASVIVMGLALWLGAGWLCLANWSRNGRRAAVGRLEALRFVLVTLLVLTLLRPEYVEHLQRTETPEIAILADGSDSMKTRDVAESNAVVSRAQWIEQELHRSFWLPLKEKAKVSVETFSAPSTNQNALNGTDLGQALENAFHHAKNLKAVLLLTDGSWNTGKSPLAVATRYREENIPVFSVAVGRETPLPDLVLEDVAAPAYGLLGEDIAVPFKVTSHLPREVKTTVSIIDENGEAAQKAIIFRQMERSKTRFFGRRGRWGT